MFEQAHPSRGARPALAEGDGAVRILSDAEDRMFDTLVEALGRLQESRADPKVRTALARARARLTAEEVARPALLPRPGQSQRVPVPSLGSLFDRALSEG
jgi:hypothetical protein